MNGVPIAIEVSGPRQIEEADPNRKMQCEQQYE